MKKTDERNTQRMSRTLQKSAQIDFIYAMLATTYSLQFIKKDGTYSIIGREKCIVDLTS